MVVEAQALTQALMVLLVALVVAVLTTTNLVERPTRQPLLSVLPRTEMLVPRLLGAVVAVELLKLVLATRVATDSRPQLLALLTGLVVVAVVLFGTLALLVTAAKVVAVAVVLLEPTKALDLVTPTV